MLGDLAAAVHSGRLSAHELVQTCIDRIEALDGPINAVTSTRFEKALAEAAAVDARSRPQNSALRLQGLPMLVKDVDDVAGLPTTHGSLLRAGVAAAARDGIVPARLRAAGAIVVGKTNTPEFAFEGYTDNRLAGATSNPWGAQWSPGGSSGGSAAALAAGMTALATATDGGGSVRIPASMCGLPGLKPTTGLIGRDPIPAWIDLHTDGLLAVCVADLRILAEVCAGPVPGDTSTGRPGTTALTEPGRIIALPRLTGTDPLPTSVAEAFETVITALERELGLPVERRSVGDLFGRLPHSPSTWDDDWLTITATEQAHLLGRSTIEQRTEDLDPQFAAVMHFGLAVTVESYLAARRRSFTNRRFLDDLLPPGTLLLTPTVVTEGFPPDGRMEGALTPGSQNGVAQTVLANLTGHPALSLPAGRLPNGLPFGVQLMAARWQDESLLDLAQEWERLRPWPLAAPGYRPFSLADLGSG